MESTQNIRNYSIIISLELRNFKWQYMMSNCVEMNDIEDNLFVLCVVYSAVHLIENANDHRTIEWYVDM